MRSAYNVLGVPGNAAPEDIEKAFAQARATYTPQRIAEDLGVADRLTEASDAYKLLRDPETRAAHDRKLAMQVSQSARPMYASRQPPDLDAERRSPLLWVGALVVALFVGGFYVQHRRQAAQAELAAIALETARQQAVAESESRDALAIDARERARREADDLAKDRAFRRESDMALSRALSLQARQESLRAQQLATERLEQQRKEYDRRADEQRRIMEGQRSVAQDRQRIRELCYINYRRYDC